MSLAGGGTLDTYVPDNLFAGEADLITESYPVSTTIEQYEVVGVITATGAIAPHDPTASDGSEVALGVATQGGTVGFAADTIAVYTSGFFNSATLVWHASLTTLAQRRSAFQGTNIHIGEL